MNTKLLNVVSLDGGVIIKKGASGGGGGNTPGGGGDTPTPDMPVIGDGKTYLYVKVPHSVFMEVRINFSQTVNHGVIVNWGDGSQEESSWSTGLISEIHEYSEAGDYVISLEPKDGCTLGLGTSSFNYSILGYSGELNVKYACQLQAIEIGNNVTSITNYAFQNCYSLHNVIISNSVTSIGNYAFDGCFSLSNIIIPDSVTSIGSYAFNACYSLTNIVIGNGVTKINSGAFDNCRLLSEVILPDSITSIADRAFYGCYNLTKIVLSNSVEVINEQTFSNCRKLHSIVLPEKYYYIGKNAFYECHMLTSIVCKGNIKNIENYAFNFCCSAKLLDLSKCTSVPTLNGTSVFSNATSLKIIVPDALYDEWIAATNWSKHASKIVKASEFNA